MIYGIVQGVVPAEALIVLGHGKPDFLLHVHAILAGSGLNKGPVKEVPVVCDIHTRFNLNRIQSCLLITTKCLSRCSKELSMQL